MIRSKNSDTSGAARTQRVRWMNAAAGPKPVVRPNIGSMALDGILWNQGVWPQDQGTGSRPKATIPSPPVDLSGESGDGSATISFTPGSDGGSPILNYQYSLNGGLTFIAFTTSPVTITGLENNTEYTIILTAINAVGASVPSAPITVTPRGYPDPPVPLLYHRGNGTIEIHFTQGSDSGSPIINYQYSIDGGLTFNEFDPAVTTSPVTITSLINENSYTINLKAMNMYNTSEPSQDIILGPVSVPQPPTSLVATAGNSSASVAFTPPVNDGGLPILSYTVTSSPGGLTATGTESPITITGLTNGVQYTFTVVATNAVGDSDPSSDSDPVTPNVQLTRMVFTSGTDTWTAPAGVTSVEYLLVGGGGGGGGAYDTGAGGGGGGGLVLTGTTPVIPGQTYTIVIGAGGVGGVGVGNGGGDGLATVGGDSSFGIIVASGGGLGGGSLADRSGEGGDQGDAGTLTSPTGGKGGRVTGGLQNQFGGGGGGGMGSDGTKAVSATNAAGGSGLDSDLTGSNVTYSAGGRGGRVQVNANGSSADANTGNGGNGASSTSGDGSTGGNGGSGLVVLTYSV